MLSCSYRVIICLLTTDADVLLVFHAHMLNPRSFLEDCMRAGHRQLWTSGMPWHLVSQAIDSSFNYNVSNDAIANWVMQTGRSWNNADDPMVRKLKCPVCTFTIQIPWTTCGIEEYPTTLQFPDFIGSGYGDGKLNYECPICNTRISKEFLSVAKFVQDTQQLLTKSTPMPGTILYPSSGKPNTPSMNANNTLNPVTFPNRMIEKVLRIQIVDLLKKPTPQPLTMEIVRKLIEVTMKDEEALRRTQNKSDNLAHLPVSVPSTARICMRKMMSRYWENFTPFALDLCGAVMRQGIFTEKMYKIDWLHSPAAPETMARLVNKYKRFVAIMAAHPKNVAVPTLDIDLAWHTHQLSPYAYYRFTTKETEKFIDHNDKIDEGRLSEAFEWTSKTYQEKYGEVYSECTCWYCETIRSAHISTFSGVLGMSKNEKGKL